jgi:MerR family transcriptional regulator, copper efflux regulator
MKTVVTAKAFKALQTTSALCKAAHVTRGQLRLYEEAGLIAPQSRTEAGYRQFGTDTVDRLKAIGHLKELGFTLADIALLLSERDQGALDEAAIQRLAADVLAKIDERIAGLQVIRAYVAPVVAGDLSVLQDEDCHFVVEFMTALSAAKSLGGADARDRLGGVELPGSAVLGV